MKTCKTKVEYEVEIPVFTESKGATLEILKENEDGFLLVHSKEHGEAYWVASELVNIPAPEITPSTPAPDILQQAKDTIAQRASERDTESERSMASCVKAFNAMYDTELSEEQGWLFMVLLKMSRAKGGNFKLDDYLDMSSYAALAGECHSSN